ncbi:MAG: hypothetical protein KatS3mg008_0873 [Acidimicrobiales bacterium]|nr:MAG: hypothetical protein KatS3mg008_0873 [Acidimicrobiales bacterium]
MSAGHAVPPRWCLGVGRRYSQGIVTSIDKMSCDAAGAAGRVVRKRAWRGAAFLAAVALLSSACSLPSNDPVAYDLETAVNFYQGCWAALDRDFARSSPEEQVEMAERAARDPRRSDVPSTCVCQFDRLREELEFEEFSRLNQRLREDPKAALPAKVAEIVDECSGEGR